MNTQQSMKTNILNPKMQVWFRWISFFERGDFQVPAVLCWGSRLIYQNLNHISLLSHVIWNYPSPRIQASPAGTFLFGTGKSRVTWVSRNGQQAMHTVLFRSIHTPEGRKTRWTWKKMIVFVFQWNQNLWYHVSLCILEKE